MIFYSYFRSSAAYRVRIAMQLKGIIPSETVFVNLREGDQHEERYRKINPQGLVPALVLNDGTVLTQSVAIIQYLDETHKNHPLLPESAVGKARVRALADAMSSDLQPITNLRVQKYLEQRWRMVEDERKEWIQHWNNVAFTALETELSQSPHTGDFCHGSAMTLADCCLVPQVFSAERFAVDMTPYPTIQRIVSNCLAHPAVQNAHPKAQPDFVA